MYRSIASFFPTNCGAGCTVGTIVLAIIIAIIILLIQALLVMILWNLTLARMFPSVPCITFWQALGLSLLVDILIG